jgi:hypothetical protein
MILAPRRIFWRLSPSTKRRCYNLSKPTQAGLPEKE